MRTIPVSAANPNDLHKSSSASSHVHCISVDVTLSARRTIHAEESLLVFSSSIVVNAATCVLAAGRAAPMSNDTCFSDDLFADLALSTSGSGASASFASGMARSPAARCAQRVCARWRRWTMYASRFSGWKKTSPPSMDGLQGMRIRRWPNVWTTAEMTISAMKTTSFISHT